MASTRKPEKLSDGSDPSEAGLPFPLRCTQRGLTRLDKDCQATMMMEKSVQRKKKLNALFSLRRQRKTIVVLSVTQEKNLPSFSLSSYLSLSLMFDVIKGRRG